MRWSEVIARLDELTARERALRVLLVPAHRGLPDQAEQPLAGPGPAAARGCGTWLDDEFLSNTVFGATCRLGTGAPAVISRSTAWPAGRSARARYTDAAYRVFTSPRRVRFKEQEYAVPRESLAERAGRDAGPVRAAGLADQLPDRGAGHPRRRLWLSTAHGRDQRLHRASTSSTPRRTRSTSARPRPCMTAAGGRPHWGKMHTRDARVPARPATRCSAPSSHCATSSTRSAGSATPTWVRYSARDRRRGSEPGRRSGADSSRMTRKVAALPRDSSREDMRERTGWRACLTMRHDDRSASGVASSARSSGRKFGTEGAGCGEASNASVPV